MALLQPMNVHRPGMLELDSPPSPDALFPIHETNEALLTPDSLSETPSLSPTVSPKPSEEATTVSDEVATIAMNRLVQGGGKKKLAVLPSLETIPKETTKTGKRRKKEGKKSKRVAEVVEDVAETEKGHVDGLMVGSRVEVRYKGGRDFFPGTVKDMNNENGTISVAYDDGDFEAAAPRLRVRFPGEREPEVLDEGSRCEVMYKGGDVPYPAVVATCVCHSDGSRSYHINYDDGEVENYIKRRQIFVQVFTKCLHLIIPNSGTPVVLPLDSRMYLHPMTVFSTAKQSRGEERQRS